MLLVNFVVVLILMSIKNSTNETFCHTVGNNTEYCGVSSSWKPRITKIEGFVAFIILAVVSSILTIIGLQILQKNLMKLYRHFTKDTKPGCITPFHVVCCCKICTYIPYRKLKTFFLFVVMHIVKVLWDGVDVSLDAYTFYKLENGELIDNVITRNVHVNNSILAFAVLGLFKIPIIIMIINSIIDQKDDAEHDEKNMKMYEGLAAAMIIYFFEDCAELVLEYFWIEKYVSLRPPWYLIGKDVVMAFLQIYTILDQFFTMGFRCGLVGVIGLEFGPLCLMPLIIVSVQFGSSTAALLRVAGAGHQYVTGIIPEECFQVKSGLLVQTPFQVGCLRGIDYAILIFNFLPFVFLGIFMIIALILVLCALIYFVSDRFYKIMKHFRSD